MPPVFDGHNDALTRADHADFAVGRSGGHLDLPRMRAGGMRGGVFAIFTPSAGEAWTTHPEPVAHEVAAAHASAAAGRLLALERAGAVDILRKVDEFDAAFAHDPDGPRVAVLHLEGAEAIDPGLEALDTWYAAGLRSLGPVWSRANSFAHGVPFLSPGSPDTGPGLTEAGRELVRRCAEMGILVDLAHLNEAGFWDVARLEAGPLVVSHAGAHALAAASRNLTDAQIDAVGASGGLVGIVFAVAFLRPDLAEDVDTPLSVVAAHARHVAERIGVEGVALGSDFDGTTIPAALGDAAGLPRLFEALRSAGFDEAELELIAWRNWRRVLASWWGG
jgi:membrane dipeptidase